MIGKILSLPFWVIARITGFLWGSIKLILSLVLGVFRFFSGHLFGAVFGALTGFLLGKKHIGVKIFNRHRKQHKKNKKR